MESRKVHWDYEVELPTGMWHIGQRNMKMRTTAMVHGVEGDRGFIVRRVVKVLGHEVEPKDWTRGEEKVDGVQKA